MINNRKKVYKIFHGLSNVVGIGWYLSEWQRNRGIISDFIIDVDNPFFKNSHYSLKLNEYSNITRHLIRVSFFVLCLFKYNLFNFYFGKSLLPFNLDLPLLRLFNKKIIMIYCGSDIRLIEIEKKRNPHWRNFDLTLNHEKYDRRKKLMMYWHNMWVHYVIAPRNLFAHASQIISKDKIIKDIWLHNLIKFDEYKLPEHNEKKIPLLVHAPSNKELKGTIYVERAIQALKEEGYQFEYREIRGISNQDARKIYHEEADIIIDQLILGGFGTLAVEGMYYGKSVVCYLIEEVKREHYPDVPIVNVTIDNIKEKLAWLIVNPDERIRLGRKGRNYVENHFNMDDVNKKLLILYETI